MAEGRADAYLYSDASTQIVELYRQRIDRYVGADEASTLRGRAVDIERQLRLVGLRAEREEILRIGQSHGIEEIALRKIVREIDLQEARYSG